ncbi:hypothetical protein BJ166DRAFT_110258 [Pestalotiopsis sp. NC0098]|nr:hypothetical protein BJ166DRAFT_110258 [Pestalotiopsis sp. NC0098]
MEVGIHYEIVNPSAGLASRGHGHQSIIYQSASQKRRKSKDACPYCMDILSWDARQGGLPSASLLSERGRPSAASESDCTEYIRAKETRPRSPVVRVQCANASSAGYTENTRIGSYHPYVSLPVSHIPVRVWCVADGRTVNLVYDTYIGTSFDGKAGDGSGVYTQRASQSPMISSHPLCTVIISKTRPCGARRTTMIENRN